MSMPKTRLRRCAQVIAARRSAGGLELVSDVSARGERQALLRHRRAADVPAQPLELLASSARAATPACSVKPPTLPAGTADPSSSEGRVCSVNTLRPARGTRAACSLRRPGAARRQAQPGGVEVSMVKQPVEHDARPDVNGIFVASSQPRLRPAKSARHGRMLRSSVSTRELTIMSQPIQREAAFLRRKQVEARRGLSRSTICLHIKKGMFPKPVPLGPRAVGWLESDIGDWIAERVKTAREGPG